MSDYAESIGGLGVTGTTGTATITLVAPGPACQGPSYTTLLPSVTLLAFIVDSGDGGSTTPATGWTLGTYAPSSYGKFQLFWGNSNSLTGTTWTWSGLSTPSQGAIIAYQNVNMVNPFDGAISQHFNAKAITGGCNGVTTANSLGGDIILAAFCSLQSSNTWSAETTVNVPLTEEYDVASSGNSSIALADGVQSAANWTTYSGATGASSATLSPSQRNSAILLALSPGIIKTASLTETTSSSDTLGSITQTIQYSESTTALDTLGSTTWTIPFNEGSASSLDSIIPTATYNLTVTEGFASASDFGTYGNIYAESISEDTSNTSSDSLSIASTIYSVTLSEGLASSGDTIGSNGIWAESIIEGSATAGEQIAYSPVTIWFVTVNEQATALDSFYPNTGTIIPVTVTESCLATDLYMPSPESYIEGYLITPNQPTLRAVVQADGNCVYFP